MRNSVRRITIQFAAENKEVLNAVKTGFNEIGKAAQKTNSQLQSFGNTLKGLFAGYLAQVGISQLTQMADSYSLLFDRIKVFTGSAGAAQSVLERINQVARENNSSIESIATVYNRLSLALSDTGVSSNQLLRISDLLTKSFRLSGSTISESTAAVIQLSQGLASGQLRGQELRSVLEQNAIIGQLLAAKLNVTRGQLMKMAEAGSITSEVFIKALNGGAIELDQNAAKLGITFEQVGLKIRDKFVVAVGEASKELDVAGKLNTGVDTIINKLPSIISAFAAFSTVLVVFKIKAAAAAGTLTVLATSIKAVLLGPVGIAAAVATAVFLIVDNWDTLKEVFYKGFLYIKRLGLEFVSFISNMVIDITEPLFGINETFRKIRENAGIAIAEVNNELKGFNKTVGMSYADVKRLDDNMADLDIKFKNVAKELPKIEVLLAALNKQYSSGKITLDQYNKELGKLEIEKLNRELKEGKINIDQFQTKLRDSIKESPEYFENAYISLKALNSIIDGNKIDQLNMKFYQGKISVEEYHEQVMALSDTFNPSSAFYTGTSDFLKNIGNVSQNVAGAITNTFTKLEDTFMDFIKTGKFAFKDFAYSVIEDINRIILRALIIRPLAQGILGSFGGSQPLPSSAVTLDASASFGTLAAKGFAPSGSGVSMFAKGGIVDGATPFTYGGSKRGIMGEAGPEAILPLTRGSDGTLGVQSNSAPVVINIVNSSGAEITQSESTGPNGERAIEILVASKVKDGFARGSFDREMKQYYGINRKGS